MMDVKTIIAKRVAQEFKDGDVVNLGIGIPTMAADFLPPSVRVILQSENGFVGLMPLAGEVDPDYRQRRRQTSLDSARWRRI